MHKHPCRENTPITWSNGNKQWRKHTESLPKKQDSVLQEEETGITIRPEVLIWYLLTGFWLEISLKGAVLANYALSGKIRYTLSKTEKDQTVLFMKLLLRIVLAELVWYIEIYYYVVLVPGPCLPHKAAKQVKPEPIRKKLLKPANHTPESTTLIDKVEEYDFETFLP